MADYNETTRTNWFKVDDIAPFLALSDEETDDGTSYLDVSGDAFVTCDDTDNTVQITCDGPLHGLIDPKASNFDHEYPIGDFDALCALIQEHLIPGAACTILSAGCERTNDFDGCITVITRDAIWSSSMTGIAEAKARELLGNPTWTI